MVSTACEVETKAPVQVGDAVGQPEMGEDRPGGEAGVDAGDRAPVTEVQARHTRPLFLGVGA